MSKENLVRNKPYTSLQHGYNSPLQRIFDYTRWSRDPTLGTYEQNVCNLKRIFLKRIYLYLHRRADIKTLHSPLPCYQNKNNEYNSFFLNGNRTHNPTCILLYVYIYNVRLTWVHSSNSLSNLRSSQYILRLRVAVIKSLC